MALIPMLMLAGAWIGSKSHVFLSKAHQDVYLAELLISHPELKADSKNIDIQTFLASGKSLETLVAEAQVIRDKFHTGSLILGAFLGLVIGLMAMNQVIFRRREDYQANKGNCYSCGRCLDYCPV
jgi:ferredoxin